MIEFEYTKANGNTSTRLAAMVKAASDNNLMLDLTDLDAAEAEFVLSQLQDYNNKVKELFDSYKFGPYLKSFKASRMSNIEVLDDV